jgi:hypothetical protein
VDAAAPGAVDAAADAPNADAACAGDACAPPADAAGPDAAPPPPPRLAAETACEPTAAPCAERAAQDGVFATYRKDFYFPDERYPEYTDPPVDGGRVQIAAVASLGGPVVSVRVDGVELSTIEQAPAGGATPPFEWWHVWPAALAPGEPAWVAFHSRDPRWDSGEPGHLVIETAEGVAVDAAFPVQATPAPLGYVTTADDGRTLLFHARNLDARPHRIGRLLVNGRDATAAACVADRVLAPGAAALFTVPLCVPAVPGDAWTVVADYEDAPPAVGVGRVLPERFPIESWTNTSDCAFPGGDPAHYARHLEAGIDTFYFHEGSCAACGCDPEAVIDAAAASDETRALVTWGALIPDGRPPLDPRGLAGIATGDESDGEIYDDAGVPNAAAKARESSQAWARYPGLPTFNGAKTSGHIGTFAGMADVQGMDLYIAACAPHITETLGAPPPRAAYDFLRNARDNHAPLPTWLYAQGLSPAWNRDSRQGTAHFQPDAAEITVQAFSALAAGAKGLMWFQTNMAEAERFPERWDAIAAADRTVRAVRDLLREGDVTGLARADAPDVLVEAVRARGALVLLAVDVAADDGPDEISCLTAQLHGEEPPHWAFLPREPLVALDVPPDLALSGAFEVVDGELRPLRLRATVEGRTLSLRVPLDPARPARLFVFADAEVSARLGGE